MNPDRCLIWRGLAQDITGTLCLILAAFVFAFYARESPGAYSDLPHPVINLQQFRALVRSGQVPIIDARSSADYKRGHVPGAWSLPVADFDAGYDKIKPRLLSHSDLLIVVYCSNMWCGLADDLQKKLIDRGFAHVGRFPDGWQEWQDNHLSEEKSP